MELRALFLAQRAGITLRPLDDVEIQMRDGLDRLRGLNAAAADICHHLMVPGEAAKRYLERRGVTMRRCVLSASGMPLTNASWSHLAAAGYSEAEIIRRASPTRAARVTSMTAFAAGSCSHRDAGPRHWLWRPAAERSRAASICFAATPLFDQGSILYGIDLARPAILESGTAVIVEGTWTSWCPTSAACTTW